MAAGREHLKDGCGCRIMTGLDVIASQEWRTMSRNRWLLGSVVLMLGFAVFLALMVHVPAGRSSMPALSVLVVSLSTLAVYFVPLIGLLMGHDAVIAEAERGTLALTLSYPVTRGAFLAGKGISHAAVLLVAIVSGFGTAAVIAWLRDGMALEPSSATAFAGLVVSTFLLGLIFLLIGYAISARVRERATAVGLAVAIWLFFVILYDLGVIGLLVASAGALPRMAVRALLLVNPTDVYRLFNLTVVGGEKLASGVTGAGVHLDLKPGTLALAGFVWLVGAGAWARRSFVHREL